MNGPEWNETTALASSFASDFGLEERHVRCDATPNVGANRTQIFDLVGAKYRLELPKLIGSGDILSETYKIVPVIAGLL